MIRTTSIGTRLLMVVGALASVALVLGANSLFQAARLFGEAEEVATVNIRTVQLAEEIRFRVEEMRSTVRLAFIDLSRQDTKSAVSRGDAVATQASALEATIAELGTVTAGNAARVEQLNGMVGEYRRLAVPIFEAVGRSDALAAADAAKPATATSNRMQEIAADVLQAETRALEEDRAAMLATHRQAKTIVWAMFVAAALVSLGAVLVVRRVNAAMRSTAADLRSATEQVLAASVQVATSANSLSQGATEQAASLEESSAAMEEMGAMTSQNSEQAGTAATLMQEVHQQVDVSHGLLGEMVGSMAAIDDSSRRVAKIVKTIDEIAFQTNILALNAAVEAARAGEAGMGFAVVADEVRSLAQRAAQAARDTADLIEDSASKARAGSEKVQQVASSIEQCTQSVQKVKAIADGVSSASRQQAQGIGQVSSAIQEMEKVTQRTAATAEESAAVSQELNAQAETTMSLVRQLEALVEGGARVSAAPEFPVRRPTPTLRVVDARRPRTAPSASPDALIPLEKSTGTYGSF